MKQNIVIDTNTLYVQGLIKVFNEFMLEETQRGSVFAEVRLKDKIETLKSVFNEERQRMVIGRGYFSGDLFQRVSPETHELVFKAR